MVVFNCGNYLQETIPLALKKRQQNKKQTGSHAKEDDTWQGI